jgi:hypothetical protein
MSTINEGTYRSRAVGLELGETGTGSPQVGVAVEFLDIGKTVTWYGNLSGGALEITIKALRIMGWKGTDLASLSVDDLVNEFSSVYADEEYQGKVTRKIKYINGTGGVAMKNVADAAKKAQIAAKLKGQILALNIPPVVGTPAAPPAAQKPAAQSDAPPHGDAEAPF